MEKSQPNPDDQRPEQSSSYAPKPTYNHYSKTLDYCLHAETKIDVRRAATRTPPNPANQQPSMNVDVSTQDTLTPRAPRVSG